jgi:hypothetical protein
MIPNQNYQQNQWVANRKWMCYWVIHTNLDFQLLNHAAVILSSAQRPKKWELYAVLVFACLGNLSCFGTKIFPSAYYLQFLEEKRLNKIAGEEKNPFTDSCRSMVNISTIKGVEDIKLCLDLCHLRVKFMIFERHYNRKLSLNEYRFGTDTLHGPFQNRYYFHHSYNIEHSYDVSISWHNQYLTWGVSKFLKIQPNNWY